jgi:hypothetical protein
MNSGHGGILSFKGQRTDEEVSAVSPEGKTFRMKNYKMNPKYT